MYPATGAYCYEKHLPVPFVFEGGPTRDQLHAATMAVTEAVWLVSGAVGCGDNGCLFVKPTGMATNGGCSCVGREGRPGVAAALGRIYRAAVSLAADLGGTDPEKPAVQP